MYPKLKIDSNDLTASWRHDKSKVQAAVGQRINTADLIIEDTTGSISITELDEVILSNNAETIRYFAGQVGKVQIDLEGITKVFKLKCYDYTKFVDMIIINEVYEDQTAAAILSSAFSEYASDFNATTYVETGYTFDRLVCNRISLARLVKILADKCGFDWYVDYDKNLHFFHQEAAEVAPFGLSDSPDNSTTYPYEMTKYEKDGLNVINRVTVRGGNYLSDDTDFEGPGNGYTTEFALPYKLHPPDGESQILVYKNTGSDGTPNWVAMVVGIDNVDDFSGPYDVLFNYEEKLLIFYAAPSNLNRGWKVTAQYEAPILVRIRSEDSYAEYGRWYDGVLRDPDISSKWVAQLAGKALLAENAMAQERGTVVIDEDGLNPGMFISIVDTLRGINSSYLISKMTTTFLGNQVAQYSIEFGKYYADLYDMLAELRRQADPWIGQEDEGLLTEMFELPTESFSFSAAVPSATETDKSSYYCGATGGNQPIKAGYWTCAA